jgi:hypothetical protein
MAGAAAAETGMRYRARTALLLRGAFMGSRPSTSLGTGATQAKTSACSGRQARRGGLRAAQRGKIQMRKLDAVRKGQANVVNVRRVHFHFTGQLALAARPLGAQQVALAGMPAHDFSSRGHLETLGGAAMRLKLQFLVLLHRSSYTTKFFRLGRRPPVATGAPGPEPRLPFSGPAEPAECSLPYAARIPLARGRQFP